jgi:hypothetical protein
MTPTFLLTTECLTMLHKCTCYFVFFILIPCIIKYVEINQQMHWFIYFFIFYDGSYMFRQNNAIIREQPEQLCSFLSHFNINMVGGKSEYNRIISHRCHVLWFFIHIFTIIALVYIYCIILLYSDLPPTILTKWLRKEHSSPLIMALFYRNM